MENFLHSWHCDTLEKIPVAAITVRREKRGKESL